MTAAATATPGAVRQFAVQPRDFIGIPSPQLAAAMSNGVNGLKSPRSLKSARTSSFGRDGILSTSTSTSTSTTTTTTTAQKARHLSQSSENRLDNLGAHLKQVPSEDDDGVNPLKRRNTDAGVDYPRRRATIAVCVALLSSSLHRRPTSDPNWIAVRGVSVQEITVRRGQTKVQAMYVSL